MELFVAKGFKKSRGLFPTSFSMKNVTYNPVGLALIGSLVYEKIKALNLEPAGIGGMTTGADPVAIATAFVSRLKNDPIQAFVIRKKPKEHGIKGDLEGNVKDGDDVVIVDDATTTGASIIHAAKVAKERGLNILAAIFLVDISEGKAIQDIKKTIPDIHPILDLKEFYF